MERNHDAATIPFNAQEQATHRLLTGENHELQINRDQHSNSPSLRSPPSIKAG